MDLKYCLYARKSTESDERQAMSIGSQIKEMTTLAEREGLSIVGIKQESFSAKNSGIRPVFNEMLAGIRSGQYDAILTWAPDRLARNAGDLGSLVDLMDQNKLQHIRTFGQTFSNTPNEKFLLMILGSQAKLENDNRGVNVKRGIRAVCEQGWRPCRPPLGYYNHSIGSNKDVILDPERHMYITGMFQRVADGESGLAIKDWFEENNVTTRAGKHISLSMIYNMLKNPFYYGEFQYGGNWYKGAHEPLVTKELFEKARVAMIEPPRGRWGGKDFTFTRYITCMNCGSKLIGEEKFRTLKSGTTNRYVYYHCSRHTGRDCIEPYLKQEVLICELVRILKPNMIKRTPEMADEFSQAVSTTREMGNIMIEEEVIAKYVQATLKRGTTGQRRMIMNNLLVSLGIKFGKLYIISSDLRQTILTRT